MEIAPYATVIDYVTILNEDEAVELSRLENPEAVIADAPKIQRQLFFATTEINAFLTRRYSLPIPVKIPYLVYANVVIAWHNMEVFQEREHVRKRYEDVIKMLKIIAKGEAGLVAEDGTTLDGITAQQTNSAGVGYGIGETVFDSPSLSGFMDGYSNGY